MTEKIGCVQHDCDECVARLAQPERTGWPAGLLQDDDRKLSKWLASKPDAKHVVDMAQPEQEPTYEELDRIASELQDLCDRQALMLGAQPKQEPVAWWDENLGVFDEKHFDQLQPLYTTPPKRPWVGLTDVDTHAIWDKDFRGWISRDSMDQIAQATEAKLKEKNT